MPIIKKRIHFYAAALVCDLFLRILASTWKVSIEDPESVLNAIEGGRRPFITLFWHRYLLPLLFIFRGAPVCVPVSEHNDGEYVAHLMNRYGISTVRGSTTHGGLSLVRQLVSSINYGVSCAITPDGPLGPKYSVQPGFALLARRTGALVCPVGVSVSSGWTFNSWDEMVLPGPFARISIVFGNPDRVAGADINESCNMQKEMMLKCSDKAAVLTGTSV